MKGMTLRRTVVGALMVLSTAGVAWSQGDPFAAYKAPADRHAALQPLVGEWDVEIKVFVPGQATPVATKGTATRVATLGGRFVEETIRAGELESRVTMGHNNWNRRYEWVVQGNTDTAFACYAGDYDAASRTFTAWGVWTYLDPKDGKEARVNLRLVSAWTGAGHDAMTTTCYATYPGAQETRTLEYSYTRKR